jgi:hypothetical protein
MEWFGKFFTYPVGEGEEQKFHQSGHYISLSVYIFVAQKARVTKLVVRYMRVTC